MEELFWEDVSWGDDVVVLFKESLFSLFFTCGEIACVVPEEIIMEYGVEMARLGMATQVERMMMFLKCPDQYEKMFLLEYTSECLMVMVEMHFPLSWITVHPKNVEKMITILLDMRGRSNAWSEREKEEIKGHVITRLFQPMEFSKELRMAADRLLDGKSSTEMYLSFLQLQWTHWCSQSPELHLRDLIETCLLLMPIDMRYEHTRCPSLLIGYQHFDRIKEWITLVGIPPSFVPGVCEYGNCMKTTLFFGTDRVEVVCFKVLYPQAFRKTEFAHPMFPTSHLALFYKKEECVKARLSPYVCLLNHEIPLIHVYGEDAALEHVLPSTEKWAYDYHVEDQASSFLFHLSLKEVDSNHNQKRARDEEGEALQCPFCRETLYRTMEAVIFAECRHVYCKGCTDRLPKAAEEGMKRCPTCHCLTFVQKVFFS